MSKHNTLTPEAAEGYAGTGRQENPYLHSSPNWFAYEIGKYLKRIGATAPRDVRMGRGYQVHANGMLFAFDTHNAVVRLD